jgi:hypothetical protein
MKDNWKSPQTIVGDAATGDKYIRRPYINNAFWAEIEKGNHILMVAPRRVGKTSIMKDLANQAMEGYVAIYKNIESESTANGLYKRIFELIIECLSSHKKLKKQIATWAKRYKITSIGEGSITIGEKEIDYKQELNNILNDLQDQPVRILLLIDEVPEVLNKMRKSGRLEEATEILHQFREFNMNEHFKKIAIVYAGSIGLLHIVQALGARPAIINHLKSIPIGPLTASEANTLIDQITVGATIQYSENHKHYLLRKIQYLLPFFIQLMVEEIDQVARGEGIHSITEKTIDYAFDNVVKTIHHFEDWQKRLTDYFPKEQYQFLKSLLSHCAQKGPISIQEVYNLGNAKGLEEDAFLDALEVLKRDGYLIESAPRIYDFTSPFLKAFWLARYPAL